MSMGPPPQAVQDLPVGDTVKAAYSSVFGRFAELIRAALAPIVVSFLLYGLRLAAGDNPAVAVLAELLLLLPYTLFAVAWHRVVLLGPAATPAPMVPVWRKRHWRFLGYTLIVTAISYGFSLLYGPLITPLATDSSVISLPEALLLMFMLLLGTYVILRLSFVFPAVAVDESYGFGARIGYRFHPHIAAELHSEWIEGFDLQQFPGDHSEIRTWTNTVNGKFFIGHGRLQPYALAGFGLQRAWVRNPTPGGVNFDDVAFVGRVGGGIDFQLDSHVGLNLESSYLAPTGDLDDLDTVSISLGLTYRF